MSASLARDNCRIDAFIDCAPAVNYALYHCNIPIIRRITLKNSGPADTSPLKMTVAIEGYSEPWTTYVSPMNAGEEVTLEPVPLKLDSLRLEGQDTRGRADLKIALNGETLFREPLSILGFYEWPTGPEKQLQKSIACFVQPSNPIIQHIMVQAVQRLTEETGLDSFRDLRLTDEKNKTYLALKVIYESILQNYQITYETPPAWSYEKRSQVVRPPHRVMSNPSLALHGKGLGIGTCIDLTLIFAACLESISMRPLIILVEEGKNTHHALLGCWQNKPGKSLELFLPHDKVTEAVEFKQLIPLETTGVTVQKRLSFREAVEAGKTYLEKKDRFIFSIDVAAARENSLFPLQFAMSPSLTHVMREAECLALEGIELTLEPKHLLFSLFLTDMDQSPPLRSAFHSLGIDVKEFRRIVEPMIERFPPVYGSQERGFLTKSNDYLHVVRDMEVMAKESVTTCR